MLRRCLLCMVLGALAAVWCGPSSVFGSDADSILKELGTILKVQPKTPEEYNKLLERLREFQKRKENESRFGITIQPPKSKNVGHRPTISGSTENPGGEVWLVVNPTGTSEYWVQPPVSVGKDGSWTAFPFVGRPGNVDKGKNFLLRAVVNPSEPLKEGQVLTSWPAAVAVSENVAVTRGE